MPKLNRKWVVGFVIIGTTCGAAILAAPFLGCSYRNHQFESFVRLQIEATDCQKTIPGYRTVCCQCFLAFDGVRNKDAVQFIGSGLRYSYNTEERIFQVAGDGEIKNGRNSIEVRSARIFVNGEQLPVRSTPLKVLVKSDGRLVNQFCDISW